MPGRKFVKSRNFPATSPPRSTRTCKRFLCSKRVASLRRPEHIPLSQAGPNLLPNQTERAAWAVAWDNSQSSDAATLKEGILTQSILGKRSVKVGLIKKTLLLYLMAYSSYGRGRENRCPVGYESSNLLGVKNGHASVAGLVHPPSGQC